MNDKCPHGVDAAAIHQEYESHGIAFACPIGKCVCCGVGFPYIDSYNSDEKTWYETTWEPKNKCGGCGGKYIKNHGKNHSRE